MPLPTPMLQTPRLTLRPFGESDGDPITAILTNPVVLRYWDAPPWPDASRVEQFLTACRELAADGTGARLVIERTSDRTFLGWCSLVKWNREFRSASLGYILDEFAWGQGYATEAARAVVQWAFEALDLNRIQAETDTRNLASAHVLEKLGFLREGTLREDCIVNGEVSDSWVFGLLRRDWRP